MPSPHRWTRTAVAAASAAVLLIGLSACAEDAGGGGAALTEDGRGEELVVQYFGTMVTMDPALAGQGPSAGLVALSYDPLIYQTPDGEYIPDLATEFGFVDDQNQVFEMTLREDVNFMGGSELDADAVVASMNYYIESGASMENVGEIASVEAIDDMSVRVTYAHPFPDAPYSMTQYVKFGSVIGPDGLADVDSLPTSVDGAGQYILDEESSITNSKYVFERNPDYWNPEAQQYEKITVQVIADVNAALNAISTDQVDYTLGDASTIESATAAGITVEQVPFFNWTLHIADRDGSHNAALQDVRVRQAIAYAINRDGIVNAVGPEVSQVSGQVLTEGGTGYVEGAGYEYDIDKAEQLLAEAGYADGFSMSIIASDAIDSNALRAQAIADSLEQVGIDVDLKVVSAGIPAFLEEAEKKEADATIWPINGTTMGRVYPGLNVILRNPSGIKDPELEALNEASLTASEEERLEIYEEMTELIAELAWNIPVLSTNDIHYIGEDVTNVEITGARPIPLIVGPAPEYAWQPVK